MADASISRTPGPPLGPSYLITIISPLIFYLKLHSYNVSELKTTAFPLKDNPSFPEIFLQSLREKDYLLIYIYDYLF